MSRAAFRLSLVLIVALCSQPLNHAQNNSYDAETTLNRIVDELYAAYAREDIEGYLKH